VLGIAAIAARLASLKIASAGQGGAHHRGALEGSESFMKKVVIVTSAVLALGLAACHNNGAANNSTNETAVENNAEYDVNAATNASVEANADEALNAAASNVENAGNAVNTAQNAVNNSTTNK
jgi:hypothetical protein